jgi:SSS family solute:Na+ symporter
VLAAIVRQGGQGLLGFVGGLPHVTERPYEKISLGELASWDLAQPTVLVILLYGLTENIRNYGTDQNYVQRMLATRSNREAIKSFWIGGLSYLPLSLVFCLIGTGLFSHYQALPERLPQGVRPDQVFPHFIKHELPEPVAGLVVAAILAAAMSTIDSSLNSTSTAILSDIVRPLRRGPPRLPEIVTLRATTVLLGVFGTAMAVWLYATYGGETSRTLMDRWWQYAGVAGGGLFGLFVLAWLCPRAPAWSAALGVAASLPVLAWGTLLNRATLAADSPWRPYGCPLHPNLVGISGTLTLVAIGAAAAWGARLGWLAPNPRAGFARTDDTAS